MIDRQRLNQHIEASGYKRAYIASHMGLSRNALQNRLAGRQDFKLGQAQRLSWLLGLSEEERDRCFWPDKRG